MNLTKGDKIVCITNDFPDLEYGKVYSVVKTRDVPNDICIEVNNLPWWFGQIGESESWTNWFVL